MKNTTGKSKKELARDAKIAALYAAICAARDTDASAEELRNSMAFVRDQLNEMFNLENVSTSMVTLYTVGRSASEGLEIAKQMLEKED